MTSASRSKGEDASKFRVKRRGKLWGVQERKRWLWRWIGLYGGRASFWPDSAGALWFANLCERVDARHLTDQEGQNR